MFIFMTTYIPHTFLPETKRLLIKKEKENKIIIKKRNAYYPPLLATHSYHQCFDLEGESGLTVRAIGTSVFLLKVNSGASPHPDSQSPGRE